MFERKKRFLFWSWPLDAIVGNLEFGFMLKRSAMGMYQSLIKEKVRAKDVVILCTKKQKGMNPRKLEHFVLYKAPGILGMSDEDMKKCFVDLGKPTSEHRVSVINEVYELAWKHIRKNTNQPHAEAA